jgi:hypothetical protein
MRNARDIVRLALGCVLTASISGCAQTYYAGYPDPRCAAVRELPDGSWLTRVPVTFRGSIKVEAGATLYQGTVIDGVDLGAFLVRRCGGEQMASGVRF